MPTTNYDWVSPEIFQEIVPSVKRYMQDRGYRPALDQLTSLTYRTAIMDFNLALEDEGLVATIERKDPFTCVTVETELHRIINKFKPKRPMFDPSIQIEMQF